MRFKHTNVHYRPRTQRREPVIRWGLEISVALTEAVDARCGQLRITRTEFVRRLVERELGNIVKPDEVKQLTVTGHEQNDDPADFLR